MIRSIVRAVGLIFYKSLLSIAVFYAIRDCQYTTSIKACGDI